jgi:galactoside O-acetyltransferase
MNNSFLSRDELLQIGFREVGDPVFISRKASFYSPERIAIGSSVRIDDFCILSGNIQIGNYIHIAAYTAIYGSEAGVEIDDFANLSSRITIYAVSDDYSGETLTNPMVPDEYKNIEQGHVHIHRHTIIGSTTVILPGTTIGEGCSIGALSMVKNDLPEWSICAGVPAQVKRPRSKNLLKLEQIFLEKESIRHDPE